MKNILLFLLLFSGISFGQIVNIPDVNFKNFLINTDGLNINNIIVPLDTNGDDEIQIIEALNIYSMPIIQSSTYIPINNFIGLEMFQNLKFIRINYSDAGVLDLSPLINLENIELKYNSNLSILNINGLTNLISLSCENNMISSLDLSTNTSLKSVNCGSNQISDINLGGLNSIISLSCESNQISTLDISNLINLKYLSCGFNQIPSLAIDNLLNLEEFSCATNLITSLNFSSLINLTKVSCDNNLLNTLDVSNLNILTVLTCNNNNIDTLMLPPSNLISKLQCDNNNITTLDLNILPNLNLLSCQNNLINNLNFSNTINLEWLIFGYNPYLSINLTPLVNLKHIQYGSNTNNLIIDFSPLVNLEDFYLQNTQYTDLNLNNSILLKKISIYDTVISNLEISNCLELNTVNFGNNQNLNSLDFSNFPNIVSFTFFGSSLTNINLKNGTSIEYIYISSCQNLQFICCNINDFQQVANAVLLGGFNNQANINSYCSFVPGGNYNTISGNVKLDVNNNGCDLLDLPINNIKFNINDGTNQGATFSNELGIYNFYTQAGSFDISPSFENPTYFNYSPITAIIPFANNNNNVTTQDFCMTANGVVNDLEIVVMPVGPARPGFDAQYKIVYKNKGNQTLSGNINFTFEDAVLDYVSSSLIPNLQTTNNLSWIFNSLLPFETRTILITLNVNSPTEIPAVNLGDVLNFTTIITPLIVDELPDDNSFNYDQIVVGSYDPNDIACLEGETLSPSEIGKYLHYAIQFENTGTFQAENVVVKVEIDTLKYDLNSLQLLNTSNPVYTKITGNIVEFIFENINLAATSGNPPVGGHGDILFKIKSKNNLVNGDNVSKKANIYFDYNAPIITNIANTIYQTLGLDVNNIDHSILVSPNPTTSFVQIKSNNNIKCIELYDVQGRILLTSLENSNKIELNISDQTNGIYFLKIKTDKGTKIEKLVKN